MKKVSLFPTLLTSSFWVLGLMACVATAAVVDSDGDGVNDYRELADSTDRTNQNSFNPLSKGLVAYYPFNGDNNDASGYFHALTSSNVSPTADRLGVVDGARYFDGSAYMRGSVRTPVAETAEVHTISAWVKTATQRHSCVAGYVNALDGSSSGNRGYQLMTSYPEGSGKYVFLQGRASVSGGWSYAEENGQSVGDDQWHHLVGVRIEGVAHIYLDGFLQTNTTDILPTFSETSRIVIGWDGFSPKAIATIDDVRIYNRALTATEVRQLYFAENTAQEITNTVNLAVTMAFQQDTQESAAMFVTPPPRLQRYTTKDLIAQMAKSFPAISTNPGTILQAVSAIDSTNEPIVFLVKNTNGLVTDVSSVLSIRDGTNDISSGTYTKKTDVTKGRSLGISTVIYDDTATATNNSTNGIRFSFSGARTSTYTFTPTKVLGEYAFKQTGSQVGAMGEGSMLDGPNTNGFIITSASFSFNGAGTSKEQQQ